MPQRGDDERTQDPRIGPSKFVLGRLLMTPAVQESVPPSEVMRALRRHAQGDWGELDREDASANERALVDGARILSAYRSEAGVKFWVITEADRSSTTVLLPRDY